MGRWDRSCSFGRFRRDFFQTVQIVPIVQKFQKFNIYWTLEALGIDNFLKICLLDKFL